MADSTVTPVPPNPPQRPNVFVGPDGLRAGWRLLIFVALVFVLSLAARPVGHRLVRSFDKDFSARNVLVAECLSFSVILIATLIMGRFERRPFADYGLPPRRMLGKQFWTGALWGFVMLSVIIGMMDASHAYNFGGLALSSLDVVKFGLLWAAAFLMVGFFEEFALRGYMQFTLTTGLGFWPAAALTSILFAAGHLSNPGENRIGVIEIVLIALFLCLALRRTGNLWFAVGWHMAFDWGESFFYSTPNSGIHATGHMLNATLMGSKWLSGGTVGPEATVFDVVVTVAGILLLLKIYPQAKYGVRPAKPLPVAPQSLAEALPAQPIAHGNAH